MTRADAEYVAKVHRDIERDPIIRVMYAVMFVLGLAIVLIPAALLLWQTLPEEQGVIHVPGSGEPWNPQSAAKLHELLRGK
jgi:hypothetical protein